MRHAPSCRQCGVSKLEFVLVVILFAMLVGIYLRYTRYYQEVAEEATVKLLLSNVRVGMAQEWVERITKVRTRDGVAELVGANPVRWLDAPPAHYLGELKSPKIDSLAAGYWFFDISTKEFAYVVNVGDNLEIIGQGSRKVLRWKVALTHNLAHDSPDFGDLALVPVSDYRWF